MSKKNGSPFHRWSKKEVDYLITNYSRCSIKQMSTYLDLSKSVILYKMRLLKLSKGRAGYWNGVSDQWLREQYLTNNKTAQEIADEIGKPLSAVTAKLNRLGLQKYNIWSKESIQFLKDHYCKDMKTQDIADELGVSLSSLRARVYLLGINKQ